MSSMKLNHGVIEIGSKVIGKVSIYVHRKASRTSDAEFKDGRSDLHSMGSLCSRKVSQAADNQDPCTSAFFLLNTFHLAYLVTQGANHYFGRAVLRETRLKPHTMVGTS